MSQAGRRETANERPEHGNSGRCYTWNSQRLCKCIWPDLLEPLDDLMREPRYPVERKIHRNPAPLVPLCPFDLALLTTKVPSVLDRSLSACQIERCVQRAEIEAGKTFLRDQISQADLRPPEKLTRWKPVARRSSKESCFQHLEVVFEPRLPRQEPVPALVIHETDLTTTGRQPQIRIVDAEQQPVLRPRREHAVGFEAALRDQVVNEDPDVRLVSPQFQWAASKRVVGGIHPGDQALRRGLLVPGCAVDLPSKKEP